MSIEVMNRVWKNSTSRGGELLVLLAIADHANDRGLAWPGIESLAKKSRLTSRHVTRCLRNLAKSGELQIQNNRGPKGTNLFQVRCFPSPDSTEVLPTSCREDKHVSLMSSEPSEPSESSIHTKGPSLTKENSRGCPAEEEVLQHAQTYPGNMASGVPAKAITEEWARNYWTWRTLDKEHWPSQWKEEMFRRFEREWRKPDSAARGYGKRSRASTAGGNKASPWTPPAPVFSGAVDLSKMRVVEVDSGRNEPLSKEKGK